MGAAGLAADYGGAGHGPIFSRMGGEPSDTGVFQGLKSPFLVGQQLKCHKFQYFNRAKTCKNVVFNT